jgi:hypothetical protein
MTVVPVIPVLQFEFSGVSFVPQADDGFLEMPARYQPLNPPIDANRTDGGVP